MFLFVFVWLRGTLPRLRYDQFMRLGWKWLVPIGLVWIVLVATVRAFRNTEGVTSGQILTAGGVVLVLLLVLTLLIPEREAEDDTDVVQLAGDYPVPPLDLKVPRPRRRRALVTTEAGGTDDGTA
jgi:NADH-quinone oxidoreductase subunit H